MPLHGSRKEIIFKSLKEINDIKTDKAVKINIIKTFAFGKKSIKIDKFLCELTTKGREPQSKHEAQ